MLLLAKLRCVKGGTRITWLCSVWLPLHVAWKRLETQPLLETRALTLSLHLDPSLLLEKSHGRWKTDSTPGSRSQLLLFIDSKLWTHGLKHTKKKAVVHSSRTKDTSTLLVSTNKEILNLLSRFGSSKRNILSIENTTDFSLERRRLLMSWVFPRLKEMTVHTMCTYSTPSLKMVTGIKFWTFKWILPRFKPTHTISRAQWPYSREELPKPSMELQSIFITMTMTGSCLEDQLLSCKETLRKEFSSIGQDKRRLSVMSTFGHQQSIVKLSVGFLTNEMESSVLSLQLLTVSMNSRSSISGLKLTKKLTPESLSSFKWLTWTMTTGKLLWKITKMKSLMCNTKDGWLSLPTSSSTFTN